MISEQGNHPSDKHMRKTAFSLISVCVAMIVFGTFGCTDKKVSPTSETPDSVVTDSASQDSLEDDILASEPVPKAADELFDDFIFNFAGNRKLQMNRVAFPLPVKGGRMNSIKRSQWKMEHFFMPQGYYTLIFNSRKAMQAVNDTSVAHAVIEKIFFRDKWVRQYEFNRVNGQWMLQRINNMPIEQNENASFLAFYERFATDSAFQVESMNSSVEVTAPNPDDDFQMQTGSIMPEQWEAFKPSLIPSGLIYNIIYGQPATGGNERIFVIRGIANGLETQMTFRFVGDSWKLVKIIT